MKNFVKITLALALLFVGTANAQRNHHKWHVGIAHDDGTVDYPSDITVTVCDLMWNCQTDVKGLHSFFLPAYLTEVNVYIDPGYPTNIEYCPVTIEWPLSGMKESGPVSHWVYVYDCGIPPVWWSYNNPAH